MSTIQMKKIAQVVKTITPEDDNSPSSFFLPTLNWVEYKKALSILGINTNTFVRDGISFESPSSFSRSLRKMDGIAKHYWKENIKERRKYSKIIRTGEEFNNFRIGDIDKTVLEITQRRSFIKESMRFSFFLFASICQRIPGGKFDVTKRSTDRLVFNADLGECLELRWLEKNVDFYIRAHPIYDVDLEGEYDNYIRDCQLYGSSPMKMFTRLHQSNTKNYSMTDEDYFFTYYIQVKQGKLFCYFLFRKPAYTAKEKKKPVQSVDDTWEEDYNEIKAQEYFSDWNCFKLEINEDGEAVSFERDTEIYQDLLYEYTSAFSFSETEDIPKPFYKDAQPKAEEKPIEVKKKSSGIIDGKMNLDFTKFVRSLDEDQISFLQKLLDLAKNK